MTSRSTNPDPVLIRLALPSEQRALEALQARASLNNPGDREALLDSPPAPRRRPGGIPRCSSVNHLLRTFGIAMPTHRDL